MYKRQRAVNSGSGNRPLLLRRGGNVFAFVALSLRLSPCLLIAHFGTYPGMDMDPGSFFPLAEHKQCGGPIPTKFLGWCM